MTGFLQVQKEIKERKKVKELFLFALKLETILEKAFDGAVDEDDDDGVGDFDDFWVLHLTNAIKKKKKKYKNDE